MNLLLRFVIVSSMLTAIHTFAAGAFEGKITLAMSAKGQPQTMDYTIKGHKMRIDMIVVAEPATEASAKKTSKKAKKSHDSGDQAVSTIMDTDKMEILMLMPNEQMYMVMPIKQPVKKSMEKPADANQEIVVTGKTETILGYKCDQIIVKDKDKGTETEMWAASELGMFMGLGKGPGGGGMFGAPKSPTSEKWEEALKGKGGFPLRVITRDAKGSETFKMEATKIEPGTPPDSLFTPPAEYQKFQMPDIGSMMNPFK